MLVVGNVASSAFLLLTPFSDAKQFWSSSTMPLLWSERIPLLVVLLRWGETSAVACKECVADTCSFPLAVAAEAVVVELRERMVSKRSCVESLKGKK